MRGKEVSIHSARKREPALDGPNDPYDGISVYIRLDYLKGAPFAEARLTEVAAADLLWQLGGALARRLKGQP